MGSSDSFTNNIKYKIELGKSRCEVKDNFDDKAGYIPKCHFFKNKAIGVFSAIRDYWAGSNDMILISRFSGMTFGGSLVLLIYIAIPTKEKSASSLTGR